jgi:integrase
MAKIGRKQKPYQSSTGDIIPGLIRQPDGRWRIVSTGQRFSEPDETKAIDRYYQIVGRPMSSQTTIEIKLADILPNGTPQSLDELTRAHADKLTHFFDAAEGLDEGGEFVDGEMGDASFKLPVPDVILWPWLRKMLSEQPAFMAKKIGIPELAGLRHLHLPQDSLKLSHIVNTYRDQNPSTDRVKRATISKFNRLIASTQAKTLDDLTPEKLTAFKKEVEESDLEPGTKQFIFNKIKTVIAFGMRAGLDAVQLSAALARCKILWTADDQPGVDPKPISKADFHKLLAAGNGSWRGWLLAGLNLCMTFEDVCGLKWKDFDMEAGTYAAYRIKTRKKKIPRAGTLWPETLDVLKRIERKGPYVFTSSHGTRFSRNSRVNDFAELRDKAELPHVTFSMLRDGAYTAAIKAKGVEEKFARVLAGHRSPGLQDHYVLRNPEIAKPACDAVYRAFGPF